MSRATQKTGTPEEDFERMMENLWGNYSKVIHDRESFEKAYDDYFEVRTVPSRGDRAIKEKVWDKMLDKHGHKINDSLFKRAGGKDWKKDRARLSPKVVVTPEEYLRLGAQKVDLAGYDTPPGFVYLGRQNIWGTSKKRTVYARVIHTKRGLRFIDKKGRYTRVKLYQARK